MPPEKLSYLTPGEKIKDDLTKETAEYIKSIRNETEKLNAEMLVQKLSEVWKRTLVFPLVQTNVQIKFEDVFKYILSKKYKSGQNMELEKTVDVLVQDHWLFTLVYGYITPENKKKISNSAPKKENSSVVQNQEKKEEGFLAQTWSKAKNFANGAVEAVSSAVDDVKEMISDFFSSISKLVNIEGVPAGQIPILKAMLEGGQAIFDKLYAMGGRGSTIDCSGFVSYMLRKGGVFKPKEYHSSKDLYNKFVAHKIVKTGARAGDLMFRGSGGGGHVEMIVSKPYQKGKKWYVKTLGSSSDTIRVDPMYNIDGSKATKKNGVAYRERDIQDKYQILRPPYEQMLADNQKRKR